MLKPLLIVLGLANVLFFAWAQGWFDAFGSGRSHGDREPERMALQQHPEAIRLLPPVTPGLPGARQAGANEAAECLEAGPFSPALLADAEAALQGSLPAGRWTALKTEELPVWIVFVGPLPGEGERQDRRAALRANGISAEEIRGVPNEGDGLVLGRFTERTAADKALASFLHRGVRDARVAAWSAGATRYTLRIQGHIDAALLAKLNALPAIAQLERPFRACPR